jgi:hypothetical protein
MTYHYHQATCPHCGKIHNQRGCDLDCCSTAIVEKKRFTSSDGHEAVKEICQETGDLYWVDYGDRPLSG